MSRLQIGQRLMIGFALILCMALGLGWIAQSRVSDIAGNLASINDVNSVKQRYTINFRGSVHDRAISLRDVILVQPSELPAVLATITRLTDAYTASAGPLDQLMASGRGVTADEQAILAEIKQTEARTLPMIAEVIRLQRAGERDAARTLMMGQARPAFDEWLARINKFIDLEEAKNKSLGAEVRGEAEGFVWLVISLCAGAILAGSAVAFWSLGAIRPIGALTEAMKKLAAGDASVIVPSLERRDEIGAMARTVEILKSGSQERARLELEAVEFQRNLDGRLRDSEAAFSSAGEAQKQVVDALAVGLSRLAEGDLTTRLTANVTGEYESLKTDFNAAIRKLQELLAEIATTGTAIRSGSGEISGAADDLSRRTEQQAASLEETAAALDEITATVKKTAEGAKHASAVVLGARTDAETSGKVVQNAVIAMSGIERSAQEISQIIGVIDEIAFQTNLLALNAGVEAARAGEAGKGFAVVASEVRALAQRSADAAKEIKALISKSSTQVASGVALVGEAGTALVRIGTHITEISGIVGAITASTQEQSMGLGEVNTAINQMDQVTQQNAAMVEETTAASHALLQEAETLSSLIARFRIGEATTSRKPEPAGRPGYSAPVIALKTVGRPSGSALRKPDATPTESWEEF